MWMLLAKNLLRTKLYEDCSRILLRIPKGRLSYQKYFSLSSKPWLPSARIVQAVQTFNSDTTIQKVETLEKKQFICVRWEDGSESLYPSVWLRDNCQCPDCFLHSAKARKLLLENLDVNIKVKDVILTEQKKKINIVWPDDHTSEFEAEWLKKRCFSDQARAKAQEELFLSERQYWGSDLELPTIDFEEVLHSDESAYKWLVTLKKVGIVLLTGAAIKQGEILKLGQRIGFLRLTFYGPTWQVQNKLDANNVAYTTEKLSFHTDYPVLQSPPGIQFLHCIKQTSTGGESEVVDGFHVANRFKEQNPYAFKILTSTFVDFTDIGVDYCDFAMQAKQRIIDVDEKGQVVRINFNNATRDTIFDIPAEKVKPFYAALKDYVGLLNSTDYKYSYKMKPGDIVVFDNWRLLHGRQSYQAGAEISRHLEGAYADWDVVMSRLRILQKNVLRRQCL
ncbi:gamma-butyrobetaine dioxygenase isoform X1 [Pseudonaja textilis]|uniref:gamma-butyrobetaine dioxygenase n=1 Tax=Pseudonaja textilis TaxID=8673 RepID=A0A670Y7K7_PSETE|nr:gamma-butyrobetaine dioxygenase isoform X1 [Pseudonaja textilis]XP_026562063.1 gamma-butyrobetaine dioxygenase isoform X1 [Pseudonaja textilis]XP_026562070.1 gamma-butyrobetaine dioxygenase isoform X1 [Pseudonaja textilis]XP_026562078.1 gamma-butyrobetaine dioxygenase isoform X1 [Pseudonaja textilis]XP_026562087.1 gamma-butyrobetaine dioxygenase isoform X1 [Pseudonaja textilis]